MAPLSNANQRPTPMGRRRKPSKVLEVKLLPDGPVVVVSGREAQTLELLLRAGKSGLTSAEASIYGWARRTSNYVFRLRQAGVPIETLRVATPDGASIARYVLAADVEVTVVLHVPFHKI